MRGALFCSIGILLIALLLSFYSTTEGFINDPNASPCGVDKPPCPYGTACMNGWCIGTNPPALPPTTGLPVLP
jgi:hypothetical protein